MRNVTDWMMEQHKNKCVHFPHWLNHQTPALLPRTQADRRITVGKQNVFWLKAGLKLLCALQKPGVQTEKYDPRPSHCFLVTEIQSVRKTKGSPHATKSVCMLQNEQTKCFCAGNCPQSMCTVPQFQHTPDDWHPGVAENTAHQSYLSQLSCSCTKTWALHHDSYSCSPEDSPTHKRLVIALLRVRCFIKSSFRHNGNKLILVLPHSI